jgi:hypothetical protein
VKKTNARKSAAKKRADAVQGFVYPRIASAFLTEIRELIKQTSAVLDFIDPIDFEEMEPMLTQSLFNLLRTRLAPAQEELEKLSGENA